MSKPSSFSEFWPHYLADHRDPLNRRLHFVGTSLMAVALVTAVATGHLRLLLLCPLLGYGFAWVGHFVIEKNRPATFTHPIWSLVGDLKMVGLMWVGRLDLSETAERRAG